MIVKGKENTCIHINTCVDLCKIFLHIQYSYIWLVLILQSLSKLPNEQADILLNIIPCVIIINFIV